VAAFVFRRRVSHAFEEAAWQAGLALRIGSWKKDLPRLPVKSLTMFAIQPHDRCTPNSLALRIEQYFKARGVPCQIPDTRRDQPQEVIDFPDVIGVGGRGGPGLSVFAAAIF